MGFEGIGEVCRRNGIRIYCGIENVIFFFRDLGLVGIYNVYDSFRLRFLEVDIGIRI